MWVVRNQFVLLLSLSFLQLPCLANASGTQRHTKAKTPAKQEQPAPPPQAAAVPPTLAQTPASAPQVSYSNGSLTIVAQNSTLGDILRAVHAQTGAVMEISGNATERVASRFGPGAPRDVLAQLLNGSQFNYVILGSPTDAGMVQRVVLTPRLAGDQETEAQNAPSAGAPNPFPRVQPPPPAQSSQDMTEDESDDSDSGDNEAQDEPAAATPAPGQPANQAPVKTPEQLLQELQRQQQQLQQQQGAQPGQNPGQPNQP